MQFRLQSTLSNMALSQAALRLCRPSRLTFYRCIYSGNALRAQYAIQDKEDFKSKVLNSKKLVVVNFRASWCGPCKMLTPRLESAVDARGEKVDLAKVDIDQQADLALEYEVEAVPAVIMFKDGQVIDRFLGLKDEDQINSFLDKAIGPS